MNSKKKVSMVLVNLSLLDLDKIESFLLKKFQVDKISSLVISQNSTVNNHVVFEIDNKKYVMKILTRKPAEEHEFYRLEKEANLMQQFKQNNELCGSNQKTIPVPNIVHIETDTNVIDYKFIIMEFIEGENLADVWENLEQEKRENLVIELAEIIREIHKVKFDMFGDIEEFDCPRRFYTFERLLKSNIRKYARIIGPRNQLPIELITKTVKFVEDNIDSIEFDTEPTLIHKDLHFGNFIIDREKSRIKAVLDFEWAEASHPFIDLFNIKEDFSFDEEQLKLFYNHYFQDGREDLAEFALFEKITNIVGIMYSIAIGWINFHPTKENLEYSIKKIKELLED